MMVQLKSLSFSILLSCCYLTDLTKAMEVSEAQQIALESSGELLPPENLVQKIETDLQAIRAKFAVVADVNHTPKWQPGKLIINGAKKETLDAIDKSPYGPIETRPIFQDTIFAVTFTKPYNPEALAKVLEKEYGLTGAEPDSIIGGSSSITLTCDQSGKNTYVFYKGSGDCPSGCINRRYWTFTVDPVGNIELVSDTGDDSTQEQPV